MAEETVLDAIRKRAPARSVLDEIRATAQEPTAGERAAGVAAGLFRGAANVAKGVFLDTPEILGRGIVKAILPEDMESQMTPEGETTLGGLSRRIERGLQYTSPESVANEPAGPGRFLTTTVPEAIGSTVGFAASGGMGGPAAAALTGALTSGSAAWHEAKASGASDETAWTAWALNAGIGTSEALPLGRLLERYTGGAAGGAIKAAVLSATEEGAQEAFQQVGSNLAASATFDEDRKALEGLAESAGAGGLSGFILSAIGSAVGAHQKGARRADVGPGAIKNEGAPLQEPQEPRAPGAPLGTVDVEAAAQLPTAPLEPAKAPDQPALPQEGLSTSPEPIAPLEQAEPTVLDSVKQAAAPQAEGQPELTDEPAPSPAVDRQTEGVPFDVPGEERQAERSTREMLDDPEIRGALEGLAAESGWAEAGGKLLRDDMGNAIGRTKWAPNAEWWRDRPEGMTERSVKRLVSKVLENPDAKLGEKQAAHLEWLIRAAHAASAPRSEPGMTADEEPQDTTSIKNRIVDRELADMGLPPAQHGESVADIERHSKAMDLLKADPLAGKRLVDELATSTRPPTGDEGALLALEVNRLLNERDAAQQAYNADPTDENQARIDAAVADYARAADVVTIAGTESSASLRIRKMMIARDYSLAAMERAVQVAKGGEPLTSEESAKILELHDKLAAASKAHEEYVTAAELKKAELEAENSLLRMKRSVARPQRARTRQTSIQQSRAKIDELFQQIAQRSSRARTGLDVETLSLVTQLAAEHVKIGYHQFAAWADEVTARLGEEIKPYLDEAWKAARKARTGELSAPIAERLKGGAKLSELGDYVQQIAEGFVADGITEREKLVDAVHEVLREVAPQVTRRETMDAISGYGEFRQLSKDEVKVKLRVLKGQMQQDSKLQDLEKRIPPKKTGVEHRAPSDEERRLVKQVNELKKKLGIKATDPETQLRSALDSIKARLKNQIADLSHQIDTKQRIVREKAPSPSDKETEALRARRDELKAQFEAIFAKPKAIPDAEAAKEKALKEQIDALIAKIRKAELAPSRSGKPTVDTKAVAEMKAQRDQLNQQLAEMRRDAKPKETRTQEEIDADRVKVATKAVEKSIEDIERQLAGGTPKAKGTPGPTTPELNALRARRDALREELEWLRRAAEPKRSKEEIALQAFKTRKANEIARLQERMTYQEFDTRPRKPIELDPEALRLQTEHETVRRQFEREKERQRLRNRTRTEKAADALKETLNLPKAFWSSFDVSAVFRQGAVLSGQDVFFRPRSFARRVGRMFHALGSEKFATRIDTEIKNHPAYPRMKKAGVEFTGVDDVLTPHEEYFQSSLANKIPGIKQSERAYRTYLNMLRFEHFQRIAAGTDGTPKADKAVANFVNVATGRGAVGHGRFAQAVNGAGLVLWAPRLYVSRFQLILGQPLTRPGARVAVAKEYGKSLAALASVYALTAIYRASLPPDDPERPDVSMDPTSPDGGKIKTGDTRIDVLAGLQQVTRLLSREGVIVMQSIRDGKAKEDAAQVAIQFLRTKVSPSISQPYALATGKDLAFGRKVERSDVLRDMFVPLPFQDIRDAMGEHGVPKGLALGLLALFGVGLQTYGTDEKKTSTASSDTKKP